MDLQAVQSVVHEAYNHYVARIGRKPGPMLDDYARRISDRQAHVLVHDGAIKGVLVLIPESDSMLLDNFAVSPEAQGLGLGRKLLEFAEQAAKSAGHTYIKLYIHELMTENIALYSRIGYVETHRVEEKGLKRVYMAKPLP
jgi:GNAT superfamily N-acetyltransferase